MYILFPALTPSCNARHKPVIEHMGPHVSEGHQSGNNVVVFIVPTKKLMIFVQLLLDINNQISQ